MTDERAAQKSNQAKISAGKLIDALVRAWGKEWRSQVPGRWVIGLLRRALENLQTYIERGDAELNWSSPLAQLVYEINYHPRLVEDEDRGLSPEDKKLLDEHLFTKEEAEKIIEGMVEDSTERLVDSYGLTLLDELTERAVIIRKGGKSTLHAPRAIEAELAALPEDKRRVRRKKLVGGFTLSDEPLGFAGEDRMGVPWIADLLFQVCPLHIDVDNNRAFYPILIGLGFKKGDPAGWADADKAAFWKSIFSAIDDFTETLGKEEKAELQLPKPTRVLPQKLEALPIVKIDRTTAQAMLPALLHKALFKDYSTLPKKEDILAEEMKRRKVGVLSFKERRELLTKVGRYIDGDYVLHDYGDHAIGFSAKLYIEHLEEEAKKLETEKQVADLFPEGRDKAIEDKLRRLRLYRRGHECIFLVLAAAYEQRTLEDVKLYKQESICRLGYDTGDKQIYQDMDEMLQSLRWVDYIFYDYRYTDTGKESLKEEGSMTGNFIYNLGDHHKYFTLDINRKWVGCVQHLLEHKVKDKKQRRTLFGGRTYYGWPMAVLPLTRDYSTPAYLLTQFLVKERGNTRIKAPGFKVVAHKVKRFIDEAHIHFREKSKQFKEFIKVLREVEIIDHIEPTIEELEKLPPSRRLNQNLRIYIQRPVGKLDNHIKGLLYQRKQTELPLDAGEK